MTGHRDQHQQRQKPANPSPSNTVTKNVDSGRLRNERRRGSQCFNRSLLLQRKAEQKAWRTPGATTGEGPAHQGAPRTAGPLTDRSGE